MNHWIVKNHTFQKYLVIKRSFWLLFFAFRVKCGEHNHIFIFWSISGKGSTSSSIFRPCVKIYIRYSLKIILSDYSKKKIKSNVEKQFYFVFYSFKSEKIKWKNNFARLYQNSSKKVFSISLFCNIYRLGPLNNIYL